MALVVKNAPVSAGDTRDSGLIPGLGRSPGVGNGNPLQWVHSVLENSMDRGAWPATVHGRRVGHAGPTNTQHKTRDVVLSLHPASKC